MSRNRTVIPGNAGQWSVTPDGLGWRYVEECLPAFSSSERSGRFLKSIVLRHDNYWRLLAFQLLLTLSYEGFAAFLSDAAQRG